MLPMDSRARIQDAPVTFLVALTAVAGTCWWWLEVERVSDLLYSAFSLAAPLGLMASTFLHADLLHLAFNVYWLWIFGAQVEIAFGSLRTLGLVIALALGSGGFEYAFLEGGVGLSGVGYGLFAFVWVLSRHDRRFWMTRTVVQLFVAWFFLCIFLTIAEILPVGNIAHGTGALLGAVLGFAVVAPHHTHRTTARSGFAAAIAIALAGTTVFRPFVNLSNGPAYELAYEGYLVVESDCAQAIELYREALALDEHQADWWYNLGVAYENCERNAEALAAYRRAVGLSPDDSAKRDAAHYLSALEAHNAWSSRDFTKAVEFYRAASELKPDDAGTWFNLAMLYSGLDREPEAIDAAKRAVGLDQSKTEYIQLLDSLRAGDSGLVEGP